MFIRRITPIIVFSVLSYSSTLAAESHNSIAYPTIEIVADSTYQVISSYDAELEELLIQFNLYNESIVGLELYNREGKMIKVWNPEIAQSGVYRSILRVADIPDGTYRLNVLINDQSYQQAVFKY